MCLISPERDGDKTYKIPFRVPSYVAFLFFSLPLSGTLYVRERVGGVEGGDAPALLLTS